MGVFPLSLSLFEKNVWEMEVKRACVCLCLFQC